MNDEHLYDELNAEILSIEEALVECGCLFAVVVSNLHWGKHEGVWCFFVPLAHSSDVGSRPLRACSLRERYNALTTGAMRQLVDAALSARIETRQAVELAISMAKKLHADIVSTELEDE